jgi:hypothetical protein
MENSNEIICKYCEKQFKTQQSRSNHIRKFHNNSVVMKQQHTSLDVVIKEQPKNQTSCQYCSKELCDRSSRWRHEKTCKEKQIVEIKKEITNLEKKQDEIMSFVKGETNNSTNQQISGDNNNTLNNNGNITNINYFQHDNLSFITPQFFKNLLKETLFEDDHTNVIPKVIEEIKFNKDHPENHNIKLDNKKSKQGEIYTKDGWKKIDEKVCIDYLTKRGYQIFKNLSELHQDQIKGRFVDSKENFTENFLNGKINEETQNKVKDVIVEGSKNIRKQTRQELEEELAKDLVI